MIRTASSIATRRLARQIWHPRPLVVLNDGFTKDQAVSCYAGENSRIPTTPFLFYSSRRAFSAKAESSSSASSSPTDVSVDETLNKLFQDSQVQIADTASAGDAWFSTAQNIAWEPAWYNLADQAIVAVKYFHDVSGWEYGWSIVGITLLMRMGLFPLMMRAQQTTSRMAHVQPELNQMKRRYEALGTPSRQDQLQFSKNIKALFAKYDVKPMRAFIAPAVQLPLFMGMFFGLKKMPGLFPDELKTGGILWFTDLTLTDPLYILPITSAASFLLLIEMGKDQMMAQDPARGQIMINVFRGLSLMMIPVCFQLDAAMLCYWTVNNVVTLGQTALLKSDGVRKKLGIWDPPKPVPGQEPQSLTDVMSNLMKKEKGEETSEAQRMKNHNHAVEAKKKTTEVIRTMTTPPPTTTTRSSKVGITGTRNR